MQVLRYENAHFKVHLHGGYVVVLTRSAVPFASILEIASACDPVQRELDKLGRRDMSLLIDTRLARGNNDIRFEEAFSEHRQRMALGFQRVAIVVQTIAGQLQNQRLAQDRGAEEAKRPRAEPRVFLSFESAIDFLTSAAAASARESLRARGEPDR